MWWSEWGVGHSQAHEEASVFWRACAPGVGLQASPHLWWDSKGRGIGVGYFFSPDWLDSDETEVFRL